MTLDQVNLFVKSVNKRMMVDGMQSINQLRIAQHADGKEYAKIMKEMKRELNG